MVAFAVIRNSSYLQNSYFYWSNDYEFVSYDLLSFVSLSLSLSSANMELLKGRVTNEQCEVFNLRYSRRKNRMTTTKIARRKGENPSFLLPRLYFAICDNPETYNSDGRLFKFNVRKTFFILRYFTPVTVSLHFFRPYNTV